MRWMDIYTTWPTIGWKHVRTWTRTFGHGLWYIGYNIICVLDRYQSWGWILLVFSIILCFAVIKLRYPFWNSQPVFHTYDWWRYGYQNVAFPIQRRGPTKNKYHCPDQIRTWSYADLPTDTGPSPIIDSSAVSLRDEWVHFIQAKGQGTQAKGQGTETDAFSTVTADILHSLLSGGDAIATYVSMYQSQTLAIDKDGGTVRATRGPVEACMVSRPYSLRTPYIDLRSVYVLEYICATTVERYRQILQTHVFQQRMREPSMDLSILRVNDAPCVGIVPWLQYTSWTVDLRIYHPQKKTKLSQTMRGVDTVASTKLPAHYHCNRIQSPTDVSYILDFVGNAPVFDVVVMPNKASILASIASTSSAKSSTSAKAKTSTSTSANTCSYYIFALKHRKIDVAYYLFKDAHVHHEDMDSATLVCIGSVSLLDPAVEHSTELFRQGWMCALQEIRSLFPQYQCLVIEGTSHNLGIADQFQHSMVGNIRIDHVREQSQYVYLHNYVHPPMHSTDAYRWLFLS